MDDQSLKLRINVVSISCYVATCNIECFKNEEDVLVREIENYKYFQIRKTRIFQRFFIHLPCLCIASALLSTLVEEKKLILILIIMGQI